MPFDGSGTYTPAAAPNFPAVGGTAISSTYYNAVINDIATALTNCLTRDGQGKPSGAINWNAQNLTGVAAFAAASGSFTTPLGAASGGTGVNASAAANGQLLIGNGSGFTLANVVAGTNITITNTAGGIKIDGTSTMTFPGAGVAVSNGTGWAASLTAPSSALVGISDSQTLTNKTLTNPVISGGASGTTAGKLGYTGGAMTFGDGSNQRTVVTLDDSQTLTNKTLTSPTINGGTFSSITLTTPTISTPTMVGTTIEDIYTITDGAAFEIDPANGSMQGITLGANRTPKGTNFNNGQSVTLAVSDAGAYTLTWTDTTFGASGVKWLYGTAPSLTTSGLTWITLWKYGGQVYGSSPGTTA